MATHINEILSFRIIIKIEEKSKKTLMRVKLDIKLYEIQ